MYNKHKDEGLIVLGFPCNQFGGQEPGNADKIRQFTRDNYNVEFPLFEKVQVNGKKACELYRYLKFNDIGRNDKT